MKAKDIILKAISSKDANRIIRAYHYSGRVVDNSQLHFGVFLKGKCGGAMSFGSSIRKDLIAPLVSGTKWYNFLELNRMAFADWLPRNSESRAISVAMRLIRKHYPHLEWIVSFADATQCGDGTIYRASGFCLTGITRNLYLAINPATGEPMHKIAAYRQGKEYEFPKWKKVEGYMLRYIYFINQNARQRLTVAEIPFSEIQKRGAGMYLGKPRSVDSIGGNASDIQSEDGGSTPTSALQPSNTQLEK